MKSPKKLSLTELKVKSFITTMDPQKTQTVKGGDEALVDSFHSFLTIGTDCKSNAGKCVESKHICQGSNAHHCLP